MENINTNNLQTPTRFNVVIRIRPILGDEKNELTTDEDLVPCATRISDKELKITKPLNEEMRIYDFDRILGVECSQEESYNRVGRKIVADVMEGYNGTIMAYGQTGSGKTYSIFGKKTSMDYNDDIQPDMGIVPRAIKQIFNTIREKSSTAQFQIRVSFMQVYMEQISDLIHDDIDDDHSNNNSNSNMIFSSNNKYRYNMKEGLQIREDPRTGIFVKGLKQIKVNSEEELLELIKYGSKFRITSATVMNKTSSRSHAILQIMVEQKRVENDSIDNQKKRIYKKGLLTIVDLAGSERISKSGTDGLRMEEAKKINISVSSLGNCINALANNTNIQHVPFRDSKLTRILTECLGGNSKTSICACISPFLMNYEETVTTLQFASRAIKIKVNAHVNEKIEMKKIKDKLTEFSKIKNLDSMMQEKNKLEKDANDLKSSFNNLKNEMMKAKSKNKARSSNAEEVSNSNNLVNNDNNSGYNGYTNANLYNAPTSDHIELQEFTSIAKKFHSMILYLQTELAKATVTISGLKDENNILKEKISKLNQ